MRWQLHELAKADTWPKRLTLFLVPLLLIGLVGGCIADQVGDTVEGAPAPAARIVPGH